MENGSHVCLSACVTDSAFGIWACYNRHLRLHTSVDTQPDADEPTHAANSMTQTLSPRVTRGRGLTAPVTKEQRGVRYEPSAAGGIALICLSAAAGGSISVGSALFILFLVNGENQMGFFFLQGNTCC